jgi:hypothetical protein
VLLGDVGVCGISGVCLLLLLLLLCGLVLGIVCGDCAEDVEWSWTGCIRGLVLLLWNQ